jgi:hypothetical protein
MLPSKLSLSSDILAGVVHGCTYLIAQNYPPALADQKLQSFLGMNLFDYNNSDGSLQASPQFWIFAVTTIPLTLITVGAWYMYKSRHDKRRNAREDLERG